MTLSLQCAWQTDADFGQSDFGFPYWPTLAKSDFLLSFSFSKHPKGVGPLKGEARRVGPEKLGPEGWGGRPKISRFFSVSRPHFRSSSLSLVEARISVPEGWEAPSPRVWGSKSECRFSGLWG